jgi:hypothetical protein
VLEQGHRGAQDPRFTVFVSEPVEVTRLRHEPRLPPRPYDGRADPSRLDLAEVGQNDIGLPGPQQFDASFVDVDPSKDDQEVGTGRPPHRVNGVNGGRPRRNAVVSSVQSTAFPAFGRRCGHQARSWR